MQFYGLVFIVGALALVTASAGGCGYLPSELAEPGAGKGGKAAQARVRAKQHTVSCETPARGFRQLSFDKLYTTSEDPDTPFQESGKLPAQYDVTAYVWGYNQCPDGGDCKTGDHYWLIGRGPEGDFSTWIVTPQYPRITVQSNCKQQLKVGQKMRFSFSRGQLVGFSP